MTSSPQPTATQSPSPEPSCVIESGGPYAEAIQLEDSCRVTIFGEPWRDIGYTLVYPIPWAVRLAGADVDNLFFNEDISSGTRHELFVMAITTNLPLDQVDATTYTYEFSGPWPIVSQDETVVTRKIVALPSGERSLLLDTSIDGVRRRRYFLVRQPPNADELDPSRSLLYVFSAQAPEFAFDSDDYQQFLEMLREMASSLKVVD